MYSTKKSRSDSSDAAEMIEELERLRAMGREGGYIFAPVHDVEGDVPLENMFAFIRIAQAQTGYGP